jgi:hypothetical protein
MRTMKLLTVVLLALVATGARAQEVSPENDKRLWCASAFYWLAGSAEDSGDATEAETYDRWSQKLLEMAGVSLTKAGFVPDRIEELIQTYDQSALSQLGTDQAAYDVATCPKLLEGQSGL